MVSCVSVSSKRGICDGTFSFYLVLSMREKLEVLSLILAMPFVELMLVAIFDYATSVLFIDYCKLLFINTFELVS